jgi:integrase
MSTAIISRPIVELLGNLLQLAGHGLDPETRRRIELEVLKPRRKRKRRGPRAMTVAKLCRLYCEHADTYYRRSDGIRTEEATTVRHALKPLRLLFARTPATQLGPLRLKKVRDEMVARGWCRKNINQQVGRIKRMYKWAVSNELLPATVYQGLLTVDGLRAGRTTARESVPVKPVPEHLMDAVLPHVSIQVQAMARLQLITGMRPGEVTIMRTCDIDQSSSPWLYRPSHHKTEHHQHERIVFLGPQCQEIVRPFLKPDEPNEFLFCPVDAESERRKRLHACRKTPMSCGNIPGSNRKRRPRRTPGDRYNTQSYARAISRACEIAFPVPEGLDADQAKQRKLEHHWHPHQLRHNAATRLRKQFGLDVAQVVLGHKTLSVTQVYAERDTESALKVMMQAG